MSRPTLLGLAAILLWASLIPVVRSLSEQIGAFTTTGLVFPLGAVLSLAHRRLFRPGQPLLGTLSVRYLLACGGLFVAYFACLYPALGMAVDRLQALEVGLMNYLWPSLTMLLSVPVLGVRPSGRLVVGALLAGAGAVLVVGSAGGLTAAGMAAHAGGQPLPYLLGASAAVCWALYSNLSRRWARDAAGSAVPVFMLATGALLGGAQWLHPEPHHWSARVAAEVGYVALVSVAGYTFWDAAVRRGDLALVTTFSYFTPLLSTLIGAAYLGVRPGGGLWLGGVTLVVAAFACGGATRTEAAVPDVRPPVHQGG